MISSLKAWDRINIVRNKQRPNAKEYVSMIFDNFFELHGDRLYGDDQAIIGGLAFLDGTPVTVIAHVKGKDLDENIKTNFAMPHPEGYRKALRLMRQAEKFNRPIICLVDTPGAYCGIGAEERGQHEAIAKSLTEMMRLKTPIISIVLGEGGSGGALALAVCDKLAMLENATYSVISPRGLASILWKDPSREEEAANIVKITSEDLYNFQICEAIIPEPKGGAHLDPEFTAAGMKSFLKLSIAELTVRSKELLLEDRYVKFRKIGVYSEKIGIRYAKSA